MGTFFVSTKDAVSSRPGGLCSGLRDHPGRPGPANHSDTTLIQRVRPPPLPSNQLPPRPWGQNCGRSPSPTRGIELGLRTKSALFGIGRGDCERSWVPTARHGRWRMGCPGVDRLHAEMGRLNPRKRAVQQHGVVAVGPCGRLYPRFLSTSLPGSYVDRYSCFGGGG